ncbi:hypothetical protein [Burkholderia anthina]|uniref:hypothetical protein n=1 Tax=Burkholderia anthina TaxID=179879 RepID=UPI00292F1098|nr:hypothetical protein [Burkholderia anthina]WJN74416.1 hypothetical protein OH687_29325 [Burkholderia anthina]
MTIDISKMKALATQLREWNWLNDQVPQDAADAIDSLLSELEASKSANEGMMKALAECREAMPERDSCDAELMMAVGDPMSVTAYVKATTQALRAELETYVDFRQSVLDPENQPSQHGTILLDAHEKEVTRLRAELEAREADRLAALEMLRMIPTTPEQMIEFIGSNFNSMEPEGWTEEKFPLEPTGDLYNVKYSLTVHDLLSAFSACGLDDAALAQRQEG